MSDTPNHTYNAPEEGTEDWHIPLNENWNALDTDVEIRDLAGNRAQYEPKAGAKFLATDTEATYVGDGQQWIRLASTGKWPDFDAITAGYVNGVPQVREHATSGSGTRADPFVVPTSIFTDYNGTLDFGKGWFEVDGLETDPSFTYDDSSPYLNGEGVRTTTLRHAQSSPTTPTVLLHSDTQSGNFGGARNMTVYGADEGDHSGTADVVRSTGDFIDHMFENVVFRWGGGSALHVGGSGSGLRVMNAWLENVGENGLQIDDAGRPKIDNVHIVGVGNAGIESTTRYGQFSNITVNATSNFGLDVDGARSHFDQIYVEATDNYGIKARGSRQAFSNIMLQDIASHAFGLFAKSSVVNSVIAEDWGSADWHSLLRVAGTDNTIVGAVGVKSPDGASDRLLRIEDDAHRTYVNGLVGKTKNGASANFTIEIGAAEECVLRNVRNVDYSQITDNGTRTLVNGWGTNAGDPNTAGQWNGHAAYAGRMDATIWDVSTDPWTKYEATPDGSSWIPAPDGTS